MAKVIEHTDVTKIAKALIANVDSVWVLVCGDYKIGIKTAILAKVRALGIESESQLYRNIEYSICDADEMKNRNIRYSHELLVCPLDGLIKDTVNNSNCSFICVGTIEG
jgi:hypothetical protein